MSVCPSVRIKIKLSLIADKAMLARIVPTDPKIEKFGSTC